MTERDALVEHKTLAAPAALDLAHLFQIFQDAALEMINLAKAARQQVARRLLAADATGAEHRDSAMPGGIEPLRDELLEFPKTPDLRIDRAFERAHRHLEGIAGVDQERPVAFDQRVPCPRFDIDSDLPGRIGLRIAQRDDLLLQPDLQPPKRHRSGGGEFQFGTIETAAEQRAAAQLASQRVNGLRLSCQRAVDA